jgi:hypothetical protein
MALGYVQVGRTRYKHVGAITEAFRHQVDVTGYRAQPDEADVVAWAESRRDEFLRAMPPRDRWWLIQACLELAQEAALVQESR